MRTRPICLHLAVAITACLVWPLAAAAAERQVMPWESTLAPGDTVPAFDADTLDDEEIRVTYEEVDSETVLLFFLSGCVTCQEMIPEWNRAYGEHGDSLRVLGVMLDREAPGFFEEVEIDFPVVRVAHHRWSKHGVRKVPLTARIGRDGVVVAVARGNASASDHVAAFTEAVFAE